MKCPNCGAEEKTLMKTCSECGEAFVRRDLLELCQLQFLVDETAKWKIPDNIRQDYIQRLDTLRYQLTRHSNHPSETAVAAAPAEIPAPVQAKPAPVAAAIEPTAPPKETIPFDQWLLSERNIKIALYSGAALLVLAGLIFVGVNWRWIPGPAKFAITFMITALMYLGGICSTCARL